MRELETDGVVAALQRTPAFVELAIVELEGYLSFRCKPVGSLLCGATQKPIGGCIDLLAPSFCFVTFLQASR